MIFAINRFCIFLFLLLLGFNVYPQWNKISNLYLPSLISQEDRQKFFDQLTSINTIDSQQFSQKQIQKTESAKLQDALTPDTNLYIKQVLAQLTTLESTEGQHEQVYAILDDTTYRDLNVLCGKDKTPAASFFNIIDQTQTISGRAALLNVLYNPITDIKMLITRQNFIKKLVSDQELYASIREKLETIKQAENTLFILLNDTHFSLISNIADRFYLKNILQLPTTLSHITLPTIFATFIGRFPKLCDKWHLPADIVARAAMLSPAVNSSIDIINSVVINIPPIRKLDDFLCKKLNKNQTLLELNHVKNNISDIVVAPAIAIAISSYFGYKSYKSHNITSLAYGAGAVIVPLLACLIIKSIYADMKDKFKTEAILHDAIGLLANMVTAIKELQKIPEVSNMLQIKNFDQDASQELKKLLTLLDDKSFTKSATWKTTKGKMMAALKFLTTLKHEFISPYLKIGKLDALTSAATLYKKFESNQNARYYFANYESQETPHLELNNFWNPFIDPNIVVTNTIELGTKNAHHNILLTGPNAGGKSTMLKAMAFALLMAQTLTIANANITFTPFTKIFTTLNISDTTGEESLYQANMNRVLTVTKEFEGLKSNEFGLLISDELFNSTGASHGSGLFGGTLEYLDQDLKNTLFATATHFEDLVNLEAVTNGSIKNFCVEEAIQNADGKRQWSYKLKPGINKQNIAFELAQEAGFNQKILDAGKALMQRTKNLQTI